MKMNILFSGNDNVFDGILTCMLSILKKTQSKEPFNVYVFVIFVLFKLKNTFSDITDTINIKNDCIQGSIFI